ncbi:MAG: SDR family NAD(P)-dependent oxidoreductase [Pseudomonadota bacterium]
MTAGKALEGRLCLVTGATRGIGRAAAIEAARRGAHVIAVGRTAGALEELDDEIQELGVAATLVQFDLTEHDSIDRLGASIFERWGRLDALIGAAGVLGDITPLAHMEPKIWNEAIAINLTANWRLLRSVDPLLRRSDAGRAAFVTALSARECRAYWGAHSITKVALETLVKTYAAETTTTAIRVNLFNPGSVDTKLRQKAMPGENKSDLARPETVAPALVDLVLPACSRSGAIYDFVEGDFIQ